MAGGDETAVLSKARCPYYVEDVDGELACAGSRACTS
jgi:hypothetical protein